MESGDRTALSLNASPSCLVVRGTVLQRVSKLFLKLSESLSGTYVSEIW